MWLRKEKSNPPSAHVQADTLYLRPATLFDYKEWVRVRSRNAEFLKPYEPSWPAGCLEPEFFQRRVDRLSREWADDKTYGFLIFEKTNNQLIGGININNVSRGAGQMASLGYWLDQKHQGKGLMHQAGKALLEYAFGPLRLARMNAATLVHNEKSRNMLLRLGFVEEGFARSYIQIDGRRQDHVLYGINATDISRPS